MANHNFIFLLIILFVLFSSCNNSTVYEKNIDIANNAWESADTLHFTPKIGRNNIKDTYLNIRHTSAFNWRNVWLNIAIKTPHDSLLVQALNIPLSQPNGKWYGDCSAEICYLSTPISSLLNYTFTDTGLYQVYLTHEMREDPLLEVMSVGVKIEDHLEKNVNEND